MLCPAQRICTSFEPTTFEQLRVSTTTTTATTTTLSSSNQRLYAPPSSSPHPPQQPPPQPPVFDPHQAHQFAVQRAPTHEILGRRVGRLNKLIKRFSGRAGSREFHTWKEDLLRAFILSDITSPVDQVTTISFLLEGDAAEDYHSLTKAVQDDWFELMRVGPTFRLHIP